MLCHDLLLDRRESESLHRPIKGAGSGKLIHIISKSTHGTHKKFRRISYSAKFLCESFFNKNTSKTN